VEKPPERDWREREREREPKEKAVKMDIDIDELLAKPKAKI
jgi:hypothetical protein